MPSNKIGQVTERRWNALVREGREAVQTVSSCQFRLGDIGLEIEKIQPKGNGPGADVYATLAIFAEEIGVEFNTFVAYRQVANAWPERTRRTDVCWTVHRELAALEDRFTIIDDPPLLPRTGERRWTVDAARRRAGRTPDRPETSGEKILKIHDLAVDDEVAAEAAADMLLRDEVAHRVMANPKARHRLDRARMDRDAQTEQVIRDRTPAVRGVEHSMVFIELLGTCQGFVTATSRAIPNLRDHPLSDAERRALYHKLDQVDAASQWCRTVVDTGDTSMDDQLAKLIRGE